MPPRSLLAYAGITQARLIPQLEVAAFAPPPCSLQSFRKARVQASVGRPTLTFRVQAG